MTDPDVLKRSVTAGDQIDYRTGGGLMQFYVYPFGGPYIAAGLPSRPPAYWSVKRDFVLRSTIHHESMWASAISIAITKVSSLGWDIKGDGPQITKRAQGLLLDANGGKGWIHFLTMQLQDYLATDNGCFIELVRATRSPVSRLLGLMHLDSARCRRTGDPEIPVVYRDRQGAEHELRAHQVRDLADMPNPGDSFFGVGFCAASRAYHAIYKLAGVELYVTEKVTGNGATGIEFIGGVVPQTMEDALLTAEEAQARKGAYLYKGKILIPIPGDVAPTSVSVPLKDLPDGFNRKEEFDIGILTYANAIGLDPQDLQPLTGQSLGSGAQSQVLDDKSAGRGLASYRQQLTHILNDVTPEAVTFLFLEKDYRDLLQQTQVTTAEVTYVLSMLAAGLISQQQAFQMLVDMDVLPKEFLPVDTTPEQSLSDSEKPQTEQDDPQTMPEEPVPAEKPAAKAVGEGYPSSVHGLLRAIETMIREATALLARGDITVDEWQQKILSALEYGYQQAYQYGAGEAMDEGALRAALETQQTYLQTFAATIAASPSWASAFDNRAQMYGESVKAAYWNGKARGLPIPSVPGDGTTQCLTLCKCWLEIDELEGDGNANVTWKLGASDLHCQTCVQRAMDWAPLQIRNGELV